MNKLKKVVAIVSALSVTALFGCASAPQMSAFQNPRPWQKGKYDATYEKLSYSVTLFNVTAGTTPDKRIKIADGSLTYTLSDAAKDTVSLDTAMQVTYNDASEAVGMVDTVNSNSIIHVNGLNTKMMNKKVSLSTREGEKSNLSYAISADYTNNKACFILGEDAKNVELPDGQYVDIPNSKHLDIPNGDYFDNESMYYLERATDIALSQTSNFYMTNLFDCFIAGKLSTLTMNGTASESLVDIVVNEKFKPYVITKEQEDAEKEQKEEAQNKLAAIVNAVKKPDDLAQKSLPKNDGEPFTIPCYAVSILMSTTNPGPPQVAYYSERPIEINGVRHTKVPLRMTYQLNEGSKPKIQYEYDICDMAFSK